MADPTPETVDMSVTYDGVNYSSPVTLDMPVTIDGAIQPQRFIARRLGNINDWVGFRFNSQTEKRMAFALMTIDHS